MVYVKMALIANISTVIIKRNNTDCQAIRYADNNSIMSVDNHPGIQLISYCIKLIINKGNPKTHIEHDWKFKVHKLICILMFLY